MFELLFKYPAEAFAEGRLILALPGWQMALIPFAVFVLAFVALGYFHARARARLGDRVVSTLLRSLALTLIIFSMTRPLLELTTPVAQPNLVAVLIDNSRSMRIPDQDGAARSDFVEREFDPLDGDLLRELRERFGVRLFKFGARAEQIDDIDALDYRDAGSNLAEALAVARKSLDGEPLAGIVVVSDGAGMQGKALDDELLALRAAGIPVHGIGLGRTEYPRDIELARVRLPQDVLRGSRVVADVTIEQRGYTGESLELLIEDDSRILHKQLLVLEPGGQSLQIPLEIEDSGTRKLKFELERRPDEMIADNNIRYAMPSVEDRQIRVLYFEGEPRFEMKFVRRAVADDENLRVVGLIRTADAKFYRIGIESPDELRNGFPSSRAELFAYDALILGSVELSLLDREQQQLIADFVGRRGGGLLLLGGRHAFAEGGYRESILRDVFPVIMAEQAAPEFTREVNIEPTAAALVHPALLLAEEREDSIARWRTLPRLTIVNPLREVKPGATLLLTGNPGNDETPLVALAAQRYGRGKVAAFAVQNSWLWQMHHEIELEDQTHELLWRQLLRWLVEDVPDPLSLSIVTDAPEAGGGVKLRSEILDSALAADPAATPRARLTLPDGSVRTRPLERHPSIAGVYQTEIDDGISGDYLVRVELDDGDTRIDSVEKGFRVSAEGNEYFDSEMNPALFGKIAAATDGVSLTPATADRLAGALDRQQRQSRMLVRHELWDMPIIFFLLVTLLCAEWAYRRWRGLV